MLSRAISRPLSLSLLLGISYIFFPLFSFSCSSALQVFAPVSSSTLPLQNRPSFPLWTPIRRSALNIPFLDAFYCNWFSLECKAWRIYYIFLFPLDCFCLDMQTGRRRESEMGSYFFHTTLLSYANFFWRLRRRHPPSFCSPLHDTHPTPTSLLFCPSLSLSLHASLHQSVLILGFPLSWLILQFIYGLAQTRTRHPH